ncbi:MAG: beta strand repeat-containing protein, partial [Gammaproteobacteria bacterium]
MSISETTAYFKFSPLALVICSILASGPVLANPQGGQVVAGQADITQTAPGRLDVIQNTDKAIIDWKGFSISSGEQTHFQQPSSSAMALNRVYGGQESLINGALTANGRVLLVNPNGVLFGKDASVNVGSLIATTSDIDNEKFLAGGQLTFDKPSQNPDAVVVNRGQIEVSDGGAVVLAAPSVTNEGLIKARLGEVVLAGTERYTLDFNGDGLLRFDLGDQAQAKDSSSANSGNKAAVSNSGTIVADGGVVQMTARVADAMLDKVINMDGVVQAQSVAEQNGTIVLSGGDSGIVAVSGTLDASGNAAGESGGDVKVLGEKVALFDGTHVDVSGDQGGGTVLVGGNYQGRGPEANAQVTVVAQDARINADAGTQGDGGKVVVWADDTTSFKGDIQARGGENGGNGGFVEVSGKNTLSFQGTVKVDANNGAVGTVLFDPNNITISNVGADDAELTSDNQILAGDNPADMTISEKAVESLAADANVILQANNDISINNLSDGILDFLASTGSVTFNADADNSGAGSLILGGVTLQTQGGDLTITADDILERGGASEIITHGGNISITTNQLDMSLLLVDSSDAAAGGNININSGGVINLFAIDSSSTNGTGGNIDIIASGNVIIPLLNSSGNASGGNIAVDSNGDISNVVNDLDIATANLINASSSNGIGGMVNLTAAGDIILDDIDTQGVNASSGGDINLIANNSINIGSNDLINIGLGTINAGGGDISLTSNQLLLQSPQIISIGGNLFVSPFDSILSFTLGGADNIANYLSLQELSAFQDGFFQIVIGHETGSGTIMVDAGGILLNDNTTLRSPNGVGTVSINGPIQNAGNDLTLIAGDRVTQSAGTIQTDGLGIDAAAVDFLSGNTLNTLALRLTGDGNSFSYDDSDDMAVGDVGTLSGVTLNNGHLNLTAIGSLAVDQAVTGVDTLSLSANNLALAANISANTTLLNAGNSIIQTGGTLQSASLGIDSASATFSSVNDVNVLAVNLRGANSPFTWTDLNNLEIGTVGSLSGIALTNGNLNLTASGNLLISHPLAGIDTLYLSANNMTLAANITANTTLLDADNQISQTAGRIQSSALAIEADNATFLSENLIDTLAAHLTGQASPFSYSDPDNLTVGSVTVDTTTLVGINLNDGNLVLEANDLALAANIAANTTLLNASNQISQSEGMTIQSSGLGIAAANVSTSLSGNVDTLAVHLSGLASSFSYSDSDNLTVGSVTVGTTTLAGISLNDGNLVLEANDLALAANIAANTTLLNASNQISQSDGMTIQSSGLGIAAANVSTPLSGNVDTLAVDLSGLASPFSYADSDNLTVGSVTVGTTTLAGITQNIGDLNLTAVGNLLIDQAISRVQNLALNAAAISTAGISTNGSQSYNGNLQLEGNFVTTNGGFSVSGNSTLMNDTNLNIFGNIIFDQIAGNYDLSVIANNADVFITTDIGPLASLFISANTIDLHDVTTNGAQTYTGIINFHSDYLTNGGSFTTNGMVNLLSNTTIGTSGGSIQFNGTVNGPNSLALAAGDTGNIILNGNAGVLNGLNITSANDLSILG